LEDAEQAGKNPRNVISTFDVEKESDEEGQDVEKEETDPNSRSDEVTN
jgi:hypothetical protein